MALADDLVLAQLLDMGYAPEAASAAIRETKGAGLQHAVQWLLENPEANDLAGWLTIEQPPAQPQPRSKPQPQRRVQAETEELEAFFSPLAIGTQRMGEQHARALQNTGAASEQSWLPPLPQRRPDVHSCNSAPDSRQLAEAQLWNPAARHDQQPQPAQRVQPGGYPTHSHQQSQLLCQPDGQPYLQHQSPSHEHWQQPEQQRQQQPPLSPLEPREVRPAAASGVAALLAREQQKADATDRVLDSALQHLQALMTQAQAMVQLAEQFRAHLARQPPEESAGQEIMAADLSDELLDMGIAAPVTKEMAGRKYHRELARQLADFLRVPLERAGGIMTLPDVFCLFNRARGTELVSPDDLLQAVKRLPKIGASMELREFADGVRVLQSLSHSNEQVVVRIATLVRGEGLGPALSVNSTAAALQVPLTIAREHLLTAEACGMLCRDDGPEGLRFFRNFFAEVQDGGA